MAQTYRIFPQSQKVLLGSAVVDEKVSLSKEMRKAGRFGAAVYRVCGTSHPHFGRILGYGKRR